MRAKRNPANLFIKAIYLFSSAVLSTISQPINTDEDLVDAANMIKNEKIQVANVNNSERTETYIIKGKRDSSEVCLNGLAARK
jgi:aspartate 1-decarboxylase